ncbi:MAG: 1,4-alpha-glucan branching protein GlgB [Burkholderiaceae bacterium]|nr:1,4-alpha-glucan branching protein GlgB [Burkholderiaceae bacterium]
MLTDHDIYLFREGTHARLYEHLGSQPRADGRGASFALWAPNARSVSVIGDWNDWNPASDPLALRGDGSGIWQAVAEDARPGNRYKFRIVSHDGARVPDKADPFAFACEPAPATASRVWPLDYDWNDAQWMAGRAARNALDAPIAIYEVHPGSWRRHDDGSFLGYRELADALVPYVRDMGFTHVELMPVTEHPFYGSWGYQTTGYFAPTSRYGSPQDLMYFIDHLHCNGIGVLLDWVPSHFPSDAHGLARFDGTFLYEHADPRQGFHPEWNSVIFNYGRHEVSAFLLSSALFWLDRYHMDGIRVDAVASMLYLDYSRKQGEWIPNRFGGRENLEAVDFLRRLNEAVYRDYPDAMTVAEESTAWPMVSRPVWLGGLGFGAKWNMGWMHDSLAYFGEDPINRRYHQDRLTFSLWYAFNENFVLPLSHDEVVHGKGSLLGKMPGDDWQKLANLRLLFGWMWTHPGKKLLFMGGELGQRREWAHEEQLDWDVLGQAGHAGLQQWVRDLNRAYGTEPALHELDFEAEGFEWIDASDAAHSIVAFLRKPRRSAPRLLVACNFTPVPRTNYALGVPAPGRWQEILNSDAASYGGAGWGNLGGADAAPVAAHGRSWSLTLTLPPLAMVVFREPGNADS